MMQINLYNKACLSEIHTRQVYVFSIKGHTYSKLILISVLFQIHKLYFLSFLKVAEKLCNSNNKLELFEINTLIDIHFE